MGKTKPALQFYCKTEKQEAPSREKKREKGDVEIRNKSEIRMCQRSVVDCRKALSANLRC